VFEGVFTALVTPFRDGEVDEPALRELVELQIAAGVDGVVPCGSTGEAATLTHAEHGRVVQIVVEAARRRVQVLAGTGSNSTRESIQLTRHAKEVGADGALLISPYYNKPTQEGIVAHYAAVARETGFPLLAYNIPGRTASNILPATLARLADVENIVGVKESCGDLAQISHAIAECPESFTFLSGDDALILPILAVGGRGAISTAANVAPREVVELVRACRSGDLARALGLHQRLLPLFRELFCETNPIPVKAALVLQGRIRDEIRLPLTRLSQANRQRLQVALKEQGLL
jgi:4-hydroxy-tetrahydrodipicolinate synthase